MDRQECAPRCTWERWSQHGMPPSSGISTIGADTPQDPSYDVIPLDDVVLQLSLCGPVDKSRPADQGTELPA